LLITRLSQDLFLEYYVTDEKAYKIRQKMNNVSYVNIKNLTYSCRQGLEQITVLRGITYEFHQGVSYGLCGPSGSGKSTLLSIVAGMEAPSGGQILFQGQDLYATPSLRLIMAKSVGMIFQVPYLIDELSLLENVMIKGLIESCNYEKASHRARILLEEVGLGGRESQRPRSLSGGEQQRVSIARALFTYPAFVIADEPTAHLDDATTRDIMSVLCSYQKAHGAGLLIASHNLSVHRKLNYVLNLEDGLLHPLNSSLSPVISNAQQELYG